MNPFDQEEKEAIFYIGSVEMLLNLSQKSKKYTNINSVLKKQFCSWKICRIVITNYNIYFFQHPEEIPNSLSDQLLKNQLDYLQEFSDILGQYILKLPSRNKSMRIINIQQIQELLDLEKLNNDQQTNFNQNNTNNKDLASDQNLNSNNPQNQSQQQQYKGLILLDDNNEEILFLRHKDLEETIKFTKSIYLSNCWQKFTDITQDFNKSIPLQKILQWLKLNTTENLSIFDFNPMEFIEDDDFQILIDFTKYTHFVQKLQIIADFTQNQDFNRLRIQEYLHNFPIKSLISLSLSNTNLTDETIQYLMASIVRNQHLISIDLSENYLTDSIFGIFLYFLDELQDLQQLQLQQNQIKCENISKFSHFMTKINQLFSNFILNLQDNLIQDDIVEALEKNIFFVKNNECVGFSEINLQNCQNTMSKFIVWRIFMGYKFYTQKFTKKKNILSLNILPLPFHYQIIQDFSQICQHMNNNINLLDNYYQNIMKNICEQANISYQEQKHNQQQNNKERQQKLQFIEQYYCSDEDERLQQFHENQITVSITRRQLDIQKVAPNKKRYIKKIKEIQKKVNITLQESNLNVEGLKLLCQEIQEQEFEYPQKYLLEFQEYLFDKLNEAILIRDHYAISYLGECCKIVGIDLGFFKDKLSQIESRQQELLQRINHFLNFSLTDAQITQQQLNQMLEELIKESLRLDLRGLPVDMLLMIKEKRDEFIIKLIDDQQQQKQLNTTKNGGQLTTTLANNQKLIFYPKFLQENLEKIHINKEIIDYFKEDLNIPSYLLQHMSQLNYQYILQLQQDLLYQYQQQLQEEQQYFNNPEDDISYYIQLALNRVSFLLDDFIVFEAQLWYPSGNDLKLCSTRLLQQYLQFSNREIYQTYYYYLDTNPYSQNNFSQFHLYNIEQMQQIYNAYELKEYQYYLQQQQLPQKSLLKYTDKSEFYSVIQPFLDAINYNIKSPQNFIELIREFITNNRDNQNIVQDEIYAQLLNTIINEKEKDYDPNLHIVFSALLTHFPPSIDYIPYIANYLLQQPEILKYYAYSIIILTNYYEKKMPSLVPWLPSVQEVEQKYQNFNHKYVISIYNQHINNKININIDSNYFITVQQLYEQICSQIQLSDQYSYWLYKETKDSIQSLHCEQQIWSIIANLKENEFIFIRKRIYNVIYKLDFNKLIDIYSQQYNQQQYQQQLLQLFFDQLRLFLTYQSQIKQFFSQQYQKEIQQLNLIYQQYEEYNEQEIIKFLQIFSILPFSFSSVFTGQNINGIDIFLIVNMFGIFIYQQNEQNYQYIQFQDIVYIYSAKTQKVNLGIIKNNSTMQKVEFSIFQNKSREMVEDIQMYNRIRILEINEIVYSYTQLQYYLHVLQVIKIKQYQQYNQQQYQMQFEFQRTNEHFTLDLPDKFKEILLVLQTKLSLNYIQQQDIIYNQPYNIYIQNTENNSAENNNKKFQLQKVKDVYNIKDPNNNTSLLDTSVNNSIIQNYNNYTQNNNVPSTVQGRGASPKKKFNPLNRSSYMQESFDVIQEEDDALQFNSNNSNINNNSNRNSSNNRNSSQQLQQQMLYDSNLHQSQLQTDNNNTNNKIQENYVSFSPTHTQKQLKQQQQNNNNSTVNQSESGYKIVVSEIIQQQDDDNQEDSQLGQSQNLLYESKILNESKQQQQQEQKQEQEQQQGSGDKKTGLWGNFLKRQKEQKLKQQQQQEKQIQAKQEEQEQEQENIRKSKEEEVKHSQKEQNKQQQKQEEEQEIRSKKKSIWGNFLQKQQEHKKQLEKEIEQEEQEEEEKENQAKKQEEEEKLQQINNNKNINNQDQKNSQANLKANLLKAMSLFPGRKPPQQQQEIKQDNEQEEEEEEEKQDDEPIREKESSSNSGNSKDKEKPQQQQQNTFANMFSKRKPVKKFTKKEKKEDDNDNENDDDNTIFGGGGNNNSKEELQQKQQTNDQNQNQNDEDNKDVVPPPAPVVKRNMHTKVKKFGKAKKQ